MKIVIIALLFLISQQAQNRQAVDWTQIDQLAQQFINNQTFPGVEYSLFSSQGTYYQKPIGYQTYPGDLFYYELNEDVRYDMASLTKVISLTSAVMYLYDRNQIKLDDLLIKYVPEANNHDKDKIKIKNLLLHNAGLAPDYPFPSTSPINVTKENIFEWMYTCVLDYPTGTKFVYSDLSAVFLQMVIEKITGTQLNEFVERNIFAPLNMKHTKYLPDLIYQASNKVAPTQNDTTWRAQLLRGVVQDPTAYILGGVSGNAGLFSAIEDKGLSVQKTETTTKYFRMFAETTVTLFTTRVDGLPYNNSRALGWDTVPQQYPSPCGTMFSQNSFGHTGYTGTMVWADKDKDLGIVLLTNRVYPEGYSSKTGKDIMWFRNNAVDLSVKLSEQKQMQKNENFVENQLQSFLNQ